MPLVWPSMATREGALDVTTLYVWFSKKKKKKTATTFNRLLTLIIATYKSSKGTHEKQFIYT